MAFVHEFSGFGPLAGFEEFGEAWGALDFGDDVACAAEGEGVEGGGSFFEVGEGGIAEGVDAHDVGGAFAIGAAFGVFAFTEFVGDAAMGDEDTDFVRVHGDVSGVEGFAIEEEGVVWFRAGDDELVHDATGDAGEGVFGFLAESDGVEFGELLAGELFEQPAGGDLEGGATAEASAEGEVGGDDGLEAREGDLSVHEAGEDTFDVVGPGGCAGLERGGEGEGGGLGLPGGGEGDFWLAGAFGGDDHVALDGHGHDEAVVIVDVFTDEVDAAGGDDEEFGFGVEMVSEAVPGLLEEVGAAVDGQLMGRFRGLG